MRCYWMTLAITLGACSASSDPKDTSDTSADTADTSTETPSADDCEWMTRSTAAELAGEEGGGSFDLGCSTGGLAYPINYCEQLNRSGLSPVSKHLD